MTLVVLACGAVGGVGLIAGMNPPLRPDAPAVAALFPPWWSAAVAFAAAGSAGAVVRTGSIPTLLIVRSDAPDLQRRLADAGAILMFDPLIVGLCGSDPTQGHTHV